MAASQGRNVKITIVSFHGLFRQLAAAKVMLSQWVLSSSLFLPSDNRVSELHRSLSISNLSENANRWGIAIEHVATMGYSIST